MTTSDHALLERWLSTGDSEAFKDIMMRHAAMVFGTCRRIVGSAEEAEDIVQECFWKLARAKVNPGAAVPAWLHTVATRQSLDHIRTAKRRSARERRYIAERPDSEQTHWKDVEPFVDEAVERLSETLRYPLITHFLENKTHAEIAKELGVSRQTVTHRIGKGLEAVRKYLRGRGIGIHIATLTGFIAAHSAEAVPATLTARLGKIAIAGSGAGSVASNTAFLGGMILMKTKLAVGGLIIVLALVALLLFTRPDTEDMGGLSEKAQAGHQSGLGPSGVDDEAPSSGVGDGEKGRDKSQNALVTSLVPPEATSATQSSNKKAHETASTRDERAEPSDITTSEEAVVISGYVMDRQSFGISDAQVFAVGDEGSAKTESDGVYSLTLAFRGPKSIQITAQAADYNYLTKHVSVQHEGQLVEEVNFVLDKGATLSGRLLNRDGVPISDAQVQRRGFEGKYGYGNGDYSSIAFTDGNGGFIMGFRESGVAVLLVTAGQYGNVGFVDVPVGLDEVVELSMPEFVSLSGHILNQDGTPAAKTIVHAVGHFTRTGVATDFKGAVGSEGAYQLDTLSPGLSYWVRVLSDNGQPLSKWYDLGPFEPAQEMIWDYTIAPSIRVTGHVLGEQTGKPITDVMIMYAKDGEVVEGPRVNRSGSYSLNLFESGTYLLFPEYDRFQREEYMAAYGREIYLEPGKHVVNFELPDTATMSVRVVDMHGAPIANAKVSRLKVTPSGVNSLFGTGQTNQDGKYEYGFFQPGLLCWFFVEKEGFIGTATEGVVAEPGLVYPERTVVLFGSGGIEGIAVGQDGRPLANAPLSIWADCGETRILHQRSRQETHVAQVTTEPDGSFVISEGIPATHAVLTIRCRLDDEEHPLTATLPPTEFAAGKVIGFGEIVLYAVADSRE